MITGKLVTQCTTDSDMISSEGSSNLFEDLRVLDDSPHGVSMVSLCPHNIDLAAVKVPTIGLVFCSNPFNKNILCQLAQVGTSVLHMDYSTYQTELVKLKLEQCNGIISWSSVKDPHQVSFQETNELSPGLKMKYTTKCKANVIHLSEGFIDMKTLKTVELGYVDMLVVPKQTLSDISTCFKV